MIIVMLASILAVIALIQQMFVLLVKTLNSEFLQQIVVVKMDIMKQDLNALNVTIIV